jgi:pimeloyl-ACP methyl ester carboxylesterase
MPPTIVLVHGAFAEPSSWDAVIDPLVDAGHPVTPPPTRCAGLAADAAAVADVVRAVDGPVVLAAHSYGGAAISNVPPTPAKSSGSSTPAASRPNPARAPSLASMFPGSTLGDALRPVPRSDGTTDLSITTERFHEQFCADVPAPQAARMAATQRPATQGALTEPSGERPLWREVPSRFVIGEEDRNIPAARQRYMAKRAGAHRTLEIPGASHAISVSHPEAVADQILEAAALQ